MNNKVVTFGCRMNIYESEVIKDHLSSIDQQNVVVFNTCAVTENAEKKAIKSIKKYKQDYPESYVIATGCAVQNNVELFSNIVEVDKILGNHEKLFLDNYQKSEKIIIDDIMSVKETAQHLISTFGSKSRAFVQVQNGCDHRCTFCIIPYGRGNSRSVPVGAIVEQLKILTENGFNEIVLTGIDTTSYGKDLPGEPTLAQMIYRVLNLVPNLPRIRLSSIDVAEIDQDLFNLFAYEPRVMPHVHISLQSGDNMILKRMKRRHNREQVIDFCNKLRDIRKNISFGADIIVGFPTETDEMFFNTKQLVKEASINYLHVFPYSIREGTPAARMPQVNSAIIKERAAILRQTGDVELQNLFRRNINQYVQVLVEKNGVGHTENFIPVKCENIKVEEGKIYKMKLSGIESNCMRAILY